MRLLVLGGTVFLSRAVAAEAVARGHDVTCAARGTSGSVPDGATFVAVDRDTPDGLAPLAGQAFDDVVDVAGISYPWVREALDVLGERAGHWTFVSTVSVYADNATEGQGRDAKVVDPLRKGSNRDGDMSEYGPIKVASEDAVREAMGDRAFVVRPGLITGPGDRSDRFGYWPGRFARGGRVVVPSSAQPCQHLDVRDLAEWIVTAGEQRLAGTYDGIGPVQPLNELLRGIAAAVGGDAELVEFDDDALEAQGVQAWAGPKSLPLWLPQSYWGMSAHDPAASVAVGLKVRPLAETATGALVTERELGLDRERTAGLSAEDEAQVLASLN